MKMKTRTALIGLIVLLMAGLASADKNATRISLFKEADTALEAAKSAQADILAPQSYAAAMKLYKKAEDRLNRGQSIEKIRQELQQALGHFNTAVESTLLAEVTFTKVLQARSDAAAVQASNYARENWDRAEAQFASAARTLEDGNVNRARKYADAAETIYRDTELAAIKVNYLSETRKLIASAKKAKVDRLAPKTLSKAESLLAQGGERSQRKPLRYRRAAPARQASQNRSEARGLYR